MIHLVLLVVQILMSVIPSSFFIEYNEDTKWFVWETAVNIATLGVQLTICYICWTLGSSAQLRRFNCILVPTADGGLRVEFKLKDSVLAAENAERACINYRVTVRSVSEDSFQTHPDLVWRS